MRYPLAVVQEFAHFSVNFGEASCPGGRFSGVLGEGFLFSLKAWWQEFWEWRYLASRLWPVKHSEPCGLMPEGLREWRGWA